MSYGLGDELHNMMNSVAELRNEIEELNIKLKKLELLRTEVRFLLGDLVEAGFGNPHNNVSGSDTVDIINERWIRLKEFSR